MNHNFEMDLLDKEHIIWQGKPLPGFRIDKDEIIGFFIGAAFILFFSLSGFTRVGNPLDAYFPFIFIGLVFFIGIGRLFSEAKERNYTYYAVTNLRALISARGELKSISLKQQATIHISVKKDGSGTITFGDPLPILRNKRQLKPPAFRYIPDARHVYTLVGNAQQAIK